MSDHDKYLALNDMLNGLFPDGEGLKGVLKQMGESGRRAVGYISFSGPATIINSNTAQELQRRGLYRAQDFAVFYRQFETDGADTVQKIKLAAVLCDVSWKAVTDAAEAAKREKAAAAQKKLDAQDAAAKTAAKADTAKTAAAKTAAAKAAGAEEGADGRTL